jgi:hypothetical protein
MGDIDSDDLKHFISDFWPDDFLNYSRDDDGDDDSDDFFFCRGLTAVLP